MRRLTIVSSLSLFLSALALAGGCGSSTTNPSNPNTNTNTTPVQACGGASRPNGTMSAQINGASWTAACINAVINIGDFISFGGPDNNTNAAIARVIGLGVLASVPGTFDVTSPTSALSVLLTVGGTQSWAANLTHGSGSITFTTLTGLATSGTFSFSLVAVPPATGTMTITNGTFNITF